MSAAQLIAMGVEVMADDPEYGARPFSTLSDLIVDAGGLSENVEAAGLREIVRMLQNAAESAIDAHGFDHPSVVQCCRFRDCMIAALKEIA